MLPIDEEFFQKTCKIKKVQKSLWIKAGNTHKHYLRRNQHESYRFELLKKKYEIKKYILDKNCFLRTNKLNELLYYSTYQNTNIIAQKYQNEIRQGNVVSKVDLITNYILQNKIILLYLNFRLKIMSYLVSYPT